MRQVFFVLNFEMNIDEYKILINIEAKPKVIKNAKDFYEKRSVLENKLTKEFSIERWKTNAVVIQTMIEMQKGKIMRNKVIDLLDQTIEELDKEKLMGFLKYHQKMIWEILHFYVFSQQKYFVKLRI